MSAPFGRPGPVFAPFDFAEGSAWTPPATGLDPSEAIVDLFAGAGGASQAIFQATGRHPDLAVNHDPDAIGVHAANHPTTEHHCDSVWRVRPESVLQGRRIGLLWASPDCRFFSRASGGRAKWKAVRSLPGVIITWATRRRPRLIFMENVVEIQQWGPLRPDGKPDPARMGRSWRWFVGRLRGLGYSVDFNPIVAANHGSATTRTRLYLVARCDAQPVRFPTPTYHKKAHRGENRWAPVADCIDWSRPARSIFEDGRELATPTCRRIVTGLQRYVINNPHPYIVDLATGQRVAPVLGTLDHQSNPNGVRPLEDPASTLTTKGRHLLISPTLIQVGYGERPGQAPRVPGLEKPLGTLVAGGEKHALIAAFLAQHNTGVVGHPATAPLSTLTTSGCQQALVTASLSTSDMEGAERVAAFFIRYNGPNIGQQIDGPAGTITTKERFALVTVVVNGVPMVMTDIRMRILHWTEMAKAQSFPDDYVLDRTADGRKLTKTTIVRLIGNSVSPPPARDLIKINLFGAPMQQMELLAA